MILPKAIILQIITIILQILVAVFYDELTSIVGFRGMLILMLCNIYATWIIIKLNVHNREKYN